MTLKSLPGWVSKIGMALAIAACVGAGSTVVSSATTNAVQDKRLDTLEANQLKVDRLADTLEVTNQKMAVLTTKLEERTGGPRN